MSTKKLRNQLVELVKARGIPGKLYYGNKKAAWRSLSADRLRHIIHLLSFDRGTWINDCDGFNHCIKGYLNYYKQLGHYGFNRFGTKVFDLEQFMFEDGKYSCGCPYPVDSAKSPEEINAWFLDYYQQTDMDIDKSEVNRFIALKEGKSIIDENGCILPEFLRK